MIRILLADPRPLMHAGLQTVLQPVRDLELLPETGEPANCPQLCRELQVDVLLLNTRQPNLRVEALLAEMAALAPQTHVLLMLGSGQTPTFDLHELLQTGGVAPFYRMIPLTSRSRRCVL